MGIFFQQRISPNEWIYPIICGSFGVSTLYTGLQRVQIGLVSRLSSQRPGTRFNVRGVDDNGYVANFVETEVVCASFDVFLKNIQNHPTYSKLYHVQYFWSFVRHFDGMRQRYQPKVTHKFVYYKRLRRCG